MASDDTVKASEINVDTHNHVVTLNGTVCSQAEKERAVMIARDSKGVKRVVNHLKMAASRRLPGLVVGGSWWALRAHRDH
jgi:osmotically-inducible protein OsmY